MTAKEPNVTSNVGDEEIVTAPLALKILVVVLGIAIIGMLALMAYKIMNGDASKPKKIVSTQASILGHQKNTVLGFDEITVVKPADSILVEVKSDATSIILQYKNDKVVTLILVDKTTGQESRVILPE